MSLHREAHERVVVTGRGVLSSIGRGVPGFAQALAEGRNGIGALADMPRVGAALSGYDGAAEFSATDLSMMDRATQFAVIAAREAVQESGLDFEGEIGTRTAVIFGSASGCLATVESTYGNFFGDRTRRMHPMTVPRIMANAPASHISLLHGITGPAFMVATACASSAYAAALGLQMIRAGVVDAAIVGGAEAALLEGNLKGWDALRVLSPDTCRPFSKGRRGLVIGEGAGMLVLESLARARARGATILGELAGCAMNSDAHHILMPSMEGQAAAIRACLDDARMSEDEVGYVNAHGTATAANDLTETKAIRRVFGHGADRLHVSSTKSMHGHTLGAAGAIELIATLISLERGFSPPTMNFVERDPECDLDYVPNEARPASCKAALSNSFAFGGHNAVLAVRAAHGM
ncbi:beta-ketoacyl synthase [Ideonella sp.]|uniref:beta-ketoacyl-[acyl-carrier-protein] synthase family protein n=1 Tax=Ideonella sp. TaxID=1929293 RepID=UPI0035B04B91